MVPTVPVSVWDQIAVVIVFVFLLGGMGWVVVKIFTKAIADVNAHYAQLLKDTNHQWQQYFDARAESNNEISQQLTERMDQIASVLGQLVTDFQRHDDMERQVLGEMAAIRRKSP
jgi:predicted PurR-regulated permease PerM